MQGVRTEEGMAPIDATAAPHDGARVERGDAKKKKGGKPPRRKRQPIELREDDLEETYVRGGGRGGMKKDHTANCVMLHHLPTGITVRCHAQRERARNRKIARQRLRALLDERVNGAASKRATKAERLRKQKQRRRRRTRKKLEEKNTAEVEEA